MYCKSGCIKKNIAEQVATPSREAYEFSNTPLFLPRLGSIQQVYSKLLHADIFHASFLPTSCSTSKQLLLYWIITVILRYIMHKIQFQILHKRQQPTAKTAGTSFAALMNHLLPSDNWVLNWECRFSQLIQTYWSSRPACVRWWCRWINGGDEDMHTHTPFFSHLTYASLSNK